MREEERQELHMSKLLGHRVMENVLTMESAVDGSTRLTSAIHLWRRKESLHIRSQDKFSQCGMCSWPWNIILSGATIKMHSWQGRMLSMAISFFFYKWSRSYPTTRGIIHRVKRYFKSLPVCGKQWRASLHASAFVLVSFVYQTPDEWHIVLGRYLAQSTKLWSFVFKQCYHGGNNKCVSLFASTVWENSRGWHIDTDWYHQRG